MYHSRHSFVVMPQEAKKLSASPSPRHACRNAYIELSCTLPSEGTSDPAWWVARVTKTTVQEVNARSCMTLLHSNNLFTIVFRIAVHRGICIASAMTRTQEITSDRTTSVSLRKPERMYQDYFLHAASGSNPSVPLVLLWRLQNADIGSGCKLQDGAAGSDDCNSAILTRLLQCRPCLFICYQWCVNMSRILILLRCIILVWKCT